MMLVVAASRPCDSAHSGTIDWRVERAAEITRAPTPRVSRTRRWAASTAQTDRWPAPGPAATVRDCLVTSGRNAVRRAADRLISAAKAYAALIAQAETIPAPMKGPTNNP